MTLDLAEITIPYADRNNTRKMRKLLILLELFKNHAVALPGH